ncbi:MAG TPA: hypothetical protein PLO37_23110 [Candidatus Hydrogenedentes bacterium]|nr:hypothetical protein [Candidatus Hydrogenedentota bacterium]HPG69749.1 hypothetical protein [Candidatus Hydrogenedentota bacterium]
MNILGISPSGFCVVALIVGLAMAAKAPAEEVKCPGTYGGHLQGIDADPGRAIYWSFTVAIVKTDMEGHLLKMVEAPTHQGDLVYHDGKVYVAVNLGKFNQEPGQADSWVYIYDAKDLSLLSKHEVQEVVHGAGGMTWCDGRFYVIGGLPDSYNENYVYEYDESLKFIRRHVIASGHTRLGIQTACYADGVFWFGCYGDPKYLLQTDEDFRLVGKFEEDWSLGVTKIGEGRYLQGITERVEGTRSTGRAVVARPGQTQNLVDGAPAK